MKIKVNGMETFLGKSTFEFIKVILHFFLFVPFLRNTKTHGVQN
jgi:hypothetical protein